MDRIHQNNRLRRIKNMGLFRVVVKDGQKALD